MRSRFTPALSEFLDGNGWNIRVEKIFNGEKIGTTSEIHIIIEDLPVEDQDSFIKEIKELSKLECTNG